MSAAPARARAQYTAKLIRGLALANNVVAVVSSNDALAHHVTRVAGDDVKFDDVENTIVALQRAGILSRVLAVKLQARYLREHRP
jgi:hypothetical protein